MAVSPVLGASDCEAIGEGFLAQPANAVSSLAFAAVGIAVWVWAASAHGFERRYRFVLGAALAAAGIGSFSYHGPQNAYAAELHDWSLIVVVVIIGSTLALAPIPMREHLRWAMIAGASVGSIAVVTVTGSTNAVFVAWVAIVSVSDTIAHRGLRRQRSAYVLVGATALAALGSFFLGRTGSPLCDPGSPLQFHAVWHVLAAVALGLYAQASEPIRAKISVR